MTSRFIFTTQCQDQVGIVAAVATCLLDHGFFIDEAAQFGDELTGRFFMRLQIRQVDDVCNTDDFKVQFQGVADRFKMEWSLDELTTRPRVMLMVSKFDHCLSDLLYRHRIGELEADITAIVSNHETLRHLADQADIPFHHIPVTAETKPQAEAQLTALIEETRSELVVLARYMQVLSAEMCEKYSGRVINIHHSFLPSFKGAKPYHRAHDRGVKLIGATAHYVTSDLDEGPIIEQMVERVDHSDSATDLVAMGRDVEASTLARAVKMHLERRVFLNGIRTVVFW
ncbi:MAG: formyltetrahydrofolate deformylase [Pseudomonadota bacterium]